MKWLTSLFTKKKTLAEVINWLDEQQSQATQELNDAQQALHNTFPQLIVDIKKAHLDIEQAELNNSNIPARAKHIITGNKDHLRKLTNRFCENLEPPETPVDYSEIDTALHQYRENTKRALAILSQFYGDNVKTFTNSLAALESALNTAKQPYNKIDEYKKIRHLITQLREHQQQQQETKEHLHQLNEHLETLTRKQETIRKEKDDLTNHPDYLAVKEDILNAAKERQNAAEAITDLFLPLNTPIKKYAHSIQDTKLANYAEDPINALSQDYSFSILKHVDPLITAITKQTIELSPERADKALAHLRKLDKTTLGSMIHRYATAKKNESDTHHHIAQRPIMKQYESYAQELKTIAAEIEQTKERMNNITIPTEDETREQLKQALKPHKITLI